MSKRLHVHLQEAGETVRLTRAVAELLRAGAMPGAEGVAAVERCAELLSQARTELFDLRRELKQATRPTRPARDGEQRG